MLPFTPQFAFHQHYFIGILSEITKISCNITFSGSLNLHFIYSTSLISSYFLKPGKTIFTWNHYNKSDSLKQTHLHITFTQNVIIIHSSSVFIIYHIYIYWRLIQTLCIVNYNDYLIYDFYLSDIHLHVTIITLDLVIKPIV